MGSAFAFIGALKATSLWIPERFFAMMVGIINSIGVLGGMVGLVFINFLIELHGWRHALMGVAGFGICWTLVLALSIRPYALPGKTPCQAKIDLSSLRSILADKTIWLLALYAGILVGVVMNTFSELYSVVFLQHTYEIPSSQAAWVASFLFIGVGIGGPLHGVITRSMIQEKAWMMICSVIVIILFVMIPLLSFMSFHSVVESALYFFLGFFTSSMLLAFSQARKRYTESARGVVFAFINTMIGVCGFIFPLLFGEVALLIHRAFPLSNELSLSLYSLAMFLVLPPLICLTFSYGD